MLEISCTYCYTDLDRENSHIALRRHGDEGVVSIHLVCHGCDTAHWFVDFDPVTLEVQ